MTHRALIVDDERLARQELRYLLQQHPSIDVVGEAGSVQEARQAIQTLDPDLIFLDIQMPGELGMALAEETRARVIFVTAHDEFALKAFDVNALDYLVKPVNPERLAKAIERCLQGVKPASTSKALDYEDFILLSHHQVPRLVKLSTIVCIIADGDYTHVMGAEGRLGMILKTMNEWEHVLPPASVLPHPAIGHHQLRAGDPFRGLLQRDHARPPEGPSAPLHEPPLRSAVPRALEGLERPQQDEGSVQPLGPDDIGAQPDVEVQLKGS